MINVIRAELFKNSRRSSFYIICIIILLTFISAPIIFKILSIDCTIEYQKQLLQLFNNIITIFPIFSILFTSILSEEYSENTLKNVIPHNINKSNYFLGKFTSQLIFMGIICLLSLGGFVISFAFSFNLDNTIQPLLIDSIRRFICAIPSFCVSIALIDLLVILFKKDSIVYIIYLIFFSQLPLIAGSLKELLPNYLNNFTNYIFLMVLSNLSKISVTSKDLVFTSLNGVFYTTILIFISYSIFKKQEIK